MKRSLIGLVAIGALIAGPAMAADMNMPLKAPAAPLAPACMWCGFYVGGNAGWAWGRDDINTTNIIGPVPPFVAVDNAAVSSAASPRINGDGFTGGGQIGYNSQSGNIVWGAEADFEYLGIKGSTSGTFPFPSTLPGGVVGPPTEFFGVATHYSTDWLFTARPRIGWAMNNWLLYATGGLAVGREHFSQTLTLLPPFVSTNTFATTQVGWTVGAGVEYALNQNWSVKAEYLYVDLGRTGANAGTLTPACTPAVCTYTNSSSAHLTANIARVGINYHFNFGGPIATRY